MPHPGVRDNYAVRDDRVALAMAMPAGGAAGGVFRPVMVG